jgi:hypothetical protein
MLLREPPFVFRILLNQFKTDCGQNLELLDVRIGGEGAAVAQSVQCLTTDWTAGVRSPTEAEDFCSNLCV